MTNKFIIIALLVGTSMPTLHAEELHVAAAANFMLPMKEIVAEFEVATGHDLTVSYGSSGRFYAQIINGAPFQVFFSADQEKPMRLVESGHAVEGSRFTYAIGTLVLWSADETLNVEGGAVLRDNSLNHLAIANPRLAPYGMAAFQVLESLGLNSDSRLRLVMGENVTQTYQFVVTGNAQAGLIALSQVIENGEIPKGAGWIVPAELHKPIRQDAVLLKSAQENAAAISFLEFMQGQQAEAIFRSYGYETD